MYRVIDGRDTGKTRKLLEKCAETGGYFICKHPERVHEKCRAYGIDDNNIKPLGYDEGVKLFSLRYAKLVYVDELELFLNNLLFNLSGYTLTLEKEDTLNVSEKAMNTLKEWLNGKD